YTTLFRSCWIKTFLKYPGSQFISLVVINIYVAKAVTTYWDVKKFLQMKQYKNKCENFPQLFKRFIDMCFYRSDRNLEFFGDFFMTVAFNISHVKHFFSHGRKLVNSLMELIF